MLLKDFMSVYQKTLGNLSISLINDDYDENDLNSDYSATLVCMEANPSDIKFLNTIDALTTRFGNYKVKRIDDIHTTTYIYIERIKQNEKS